MRVDLDPESGETIIVPSDTLIQRSCIGAFSVHNLHYVTYNSNDIRNYIINGK